MLQKMVDAFKGDDVEDNKIKATVVLMKKNVLDFNDWSASVIDRVDELIGKGVSLQLISAVNGDPGSGFRGKVGEEAYMEDWITTIAPLVGGETAYDVTFDWDEEMGVPGGFVIRNMHHNEFFLKTLTLHHVPSHGPLHFVCNSWLYPSKYYTNPRVFFANMAYLPRDTPPPLLPYRQDELARLRGDGLSHSQLQEWDTVYDYAFYNDLGDPDKGPHHARPVLGGSSHYPYPRRGRTSRPPTHSDPKTESRLSLVSSLDIYVPRDERFGHIKMSDFLVYVLKSIVQVFKPELESVYDSTPSEFDSFQDVLDLYIGGIKLPSGSSTHNIIQNIPAELLKEIVRTDGENLLQYPMPQVIKADKSAWSTDAEFAREMLAGTNPLCISLLREFPPTSKLDSNVYGNQASSIMKEHIEPNINGLSINEAIKMNKMFILDHHDSIMPYLRKINTTSTKTYATRTILFLKEDGTLKPVAIELSLPHPDGDQFGAINKVYTPAEDGIAGFSWKLAKAYVSVNDTGYHQLISHWLHTHAVIEPFIIATNRQLSVMHPINKLLHPHFRDTMNINAIARQFLIDADGLVETIFFPAKYSMEMTSFLYKNWVFPEQALPADLIKRGMAVEDSRSAHGVRLLVEDYPYAVDGLEIWSAIETWVGEYCSLYYKSDEEVRGDEEVQSWWKEVREEGHGDKKDEAWWPEMRSLGELRGACTIIIWIASALHAAVNFGQYPYGGYMLCRPTKSRRLMPEYEEGVEVEKAVLKTVTGQLETLLGVALVEILSRHSSDEVYLGHREDTAWTSHAGVLEAFGRFRDTLAAVEHRITQMNKDGRWRNRVGPVDMPYTLLFPSSHGGLTGMGIPNSTSI